MSEHYISNILLCKLIRSPSLVGLTPLPRTMASAEVGAYPIHGSLATEAGGNHTIEQISSLRN
jgi:hypothetical protein